MISRRGRIKLQLFLLVRATVVTVVDRVFTSGGYCLILSFQELLLFLLILYGLPLDALNLL